MLSSSGARAQLGRMPIFLWSDFVDEKKGGLFMYAPGDEVMATLKDSPIDSATLKAVFSQICLRPTPQNQRKMFLKVVMPQERLYLRGLSHEDAVTKLCLKTFEMKTNNFQNYFFFGDVNLVISVNLNGIYFHIFSDKCHFAKIHHRSDPLFCYHFKFLNFNKKNITEYVADAAVFTREAVDLYTSLFDE